jgi:hypothetical protein
MLGDHQNPSERAAAALQRDAAVGRTVRARRWLLAGAAALTAALAGLASALLPGKSLGAKPHAGVVKPGQPAPRSSSSAAPGLPPPAGAAALGLQGGGDGGQANSGTPAQGNSGTPGQANSGTPAPQPAPAPQSAPAPQPAPAPSGNSGVVSGGS